MLSFLPSIRSKTKKKFLPKPLKKNYHTTKQASFKFPYSKQSSIAGENYNRWLAAPGAFLIQLSIGSVYAWSIFNDPLTREFGVVASSFGDWGLEAVVPVYSIGAVMLGITTWVMGPWVERNGARRAAGLAAVFWCSGLLIASLACQFHSLPMLYLGYSFFGGIGWGLGYISPVSTLIKWFPDRKGMATGLAVSAFGGGAIVGAPMNEYFINKNFVPPTYLGTSDTVSLLTVEGRRFVEIAGELKEVLVVNAQELLNFPGLSEGVYMVGTGNAGTGATFLTLAVIHFFSIIVGSLIIKSPKAGWLPKGYTPPVNVSHMATGSVNFKDVIRTPQYYYFLISLVGFSIAGVSIIACAKTIMTDVFGRSMPLLVTGGFTAAYVATLSAANGGGRLFWASFSDWAGRKNTYYLFGTALPLALMIPYITSMVSNGESSVALLVTFFTGTVLLVSFYGGIFSVLPAYISEIFGPKYVGAIHGRILPAWSASALIGPTLLSGLRGYSYSTEIRVLADKVDPAVFEKEFDSPKTNLDQLIEAKTVTISKLLEIAPPGTIDPTPLLYNTTIYSMCGLIMIAVVANYKMKVADSKFFEKEEEPKK